jgi:hypothetical protein
MARMAVRLCWMGWARQLTSRAPCPCSWPGVVKAADEFGKANNLTVHNAQSKWWIFKPAN